MAEIKSPRAAKLNKGRKLSDLQQYDIDNNEEWIAAAPIMFAVAEAFFTDPAAKWSALRCAKGNRAACRTLAQSMKAYHPTGNNARCTMQLQKGITDWLRGCPGVLLHQESLYHASVGPEAVDRYVKEVCSDWEQHVHLTPGYDLRVWFDNLECFKRDTRFHAKEAAADHRNHSPLEDDANYEPIEIVGCGCKLEGLRCQDGRCACVMEGQPCDPKTCGNCCGSMMQCNLQTPLVGFQCVT